MPDDKPVSFAKSLFAGHLHADTVFPYPRLERAESRTVTRLIDSTVDPNRRHNGSGSWHQ